MNTKAKLALAALAILGLGAAGAGSGGGQSSGGGAKPQRTPTTPPGTPPSPEGEERNDDEGRAWGTFYANRDAAKHWELNVFSVAASASDAAIGTGKVIADVYETIVANASWEWSGQVCKALRWELTFVAGHLTAYRVVPSSLACQSVRPMHEVFGQTMRWVQVGPRVLLTVDTESGINRRSPDKMVTDAARKPGKGSGTGRFSEGFGNFEEDTYPQWDNDNVASGYVTLDAAWIFNPA